MVLQARATTVAVASGDRCRQLGSRSTREIKVERGGHYAKHEASHAWTNGAPDGDWWRRLGADVVVRSSLVSYRLSCVRFECRWSLSCLPSLSIPSLRCPPHSLIMYLAHVAYGNHPKMPLCCAIAVTFFISGPRCIVYAPGTAEISNTDLD